MIWRILLLWLSLGGDLAFASLPKHPGALPASATSGTVNGCTADRNTDLTFAKDGFTLNTGTNTFGIIASNVYGVRATNNLTVNLPVTVTFQYDSNGNLTNDGTRSFVYDAENQLTNVFVANQWKTEFVYDGFGRRRISKDFAWQGTNWAKTNETRYLCDGLLAIQERDSNNAVQVTYTRGLDLSGSLQGAGGIGGLLAMTLPSTINSPPSTSYYHADGVGNITSLIDSRQNIVARYLYDPFGRALAQSGELATLNSMGFSSMTMHRASGMVAYPYRFYDPALGRWLSTDPIGEAGGVNLYGFVGNSPYYAIDPLGLSWDDWFDWQSSKEYFWGLTGKFTDTLIENARFNANLASQELRPLNNLLFDRALKAHNYLNDRIYGMDPNCPPHSDWSHRGGYAGTTLAIVASLLAGGEEEAAESAQARTVRDFLQQVARRAQKKKGGSGNIAGINKHKYAGELIDRYQRRFGPVGGGLTMEQSYLGGMHLGRQVNELGSVRLDVVEGAVNSPSAVFDFKFTIDPNPVMSPGRINDIRANAGLGPSVPITVIHP